MNLGSTKETAGRIAGGCIIQEVREKGRYADVFVSPQGENWYVREVVFIANARGREPVPDGRQSGHVASVGEPVSLCGMLEDAIRRGGTENRGEIVIEGREVARQCAEEGQVFLDVVADREGVVGGGAQPTVHLAIAVLASATSIGVIRVGVGGPDEGGEPGGRMSFAMVVQIGQTCLFAVGPGQPSQEMVEATILHHHDDDVVDVRCRWRGQWQCRRSSDFGAAAERGCGCRASDIQEEISAIDRDVSSPVPRGGCRERKV